MGGAGARLADVAALGEGDGAVQLEVRLEREAPARREVAGALRDAERCPEPARG